LWKSFNLKIGVAGEACLATEIGKQGMGADLERSHYRLPQQLEYPA
jgi:hypothetical protein